MNYVKVKNWQIKRCKKCDCQIALLQSKNGSYYPVEFHGILWVPRNEFHSCENAKNKRKKLRDESMRAKQDEIDNRVNFLLLKLKKNDRLNGHEFDFLDDANHVFTDKDVEQLESILESTK